MKKNKHNKIILPIIIIVSIIIFSVISLIIKLTNNKITPRPISAIDINDSIYEGKKIYEKNGDIIIENEDGTKTIETTKTKEKTGLVKTTDKEKQKYEISDVEISKKSGNTQIEGKVKNNDLKDHTIIINIKFYTEENIIKGESSTKIEIPKKGIKDFNMKIMEDLTQYKYKIEVEYEK